MPARNATAAGPALGAVFLGLATLLVGCTIGPSNRPELATSGPSALRLAPQSTVSTMPTGPGGAGPNGGRRSPGLPARRRYRLWTH